MLSIFQVTLGQFSLVQLGLKTRALNLPSNHTLFFHIVQLVETSSEFA